MGHGRPLTWAEAHWIVMDESIKEIQTQASPELSAIVGLIVLLIAIGLLAYKFRDEIFELKARIVERFTKLKGD